MDLQRLREQIEFYFCDANYARDKFMMAKATENDGAIPIQILLTFKRLKAMNPTIDHIKEAVKESDIVEVEENALRKVQTQAFKDYLNDKEISKRILYMKGFSSTLELDDIKEILKEHCNPVKITLRRNERREFKGSCFVEFASQEEAERVLEMEISNKTSHKNKTDNKTDSKTEESNGERNKKQKLEQEFLEITRKEAYLASGKRGKEAKEAKKDEAFSEKVKLSFIPKLYRFVSSVDFDISKIKETIPECAFVDIPKKVIRMKSVQSWDEKEFVEGETKETIKLTKMSEEEAKEHLKGLKIRKIGKNRQ